MADRRSPLSETRLGQGLIEFVVRILKIVLIIKKSRATQEVKLTSFYYIHIAPHTHESFFIIKLASFDIE